MALIRPLILIADYVPSTDLAGLPAEHRHEPALGLDGGEDGLALVARIIEGAPEHLTDEGVLVVEIGDRGGALETRYPRLHFTWVELEHGGERVFVIEAETLRRYRANAP
jgi:ribosomal protein L3 glutamine methyltransferase